MGNPESKPVNNSGRPVQSQPTPSLATKLPHSEVPYTLFSVPKDEEAKANAEKITVVKEADVFKTQTDPDIERFREIAEFLPLIKTTAKGKNWVFEDQLDLLNIRSLFHVCEKYKEMCDKFSLAAAKQQKEIGNKIKGVDALTAKSLRQLRSKQQEVVRFEDPLRLIDNMNESIMQCNENLKNLVAITKRLAAALPDDSKMEEPLPIAVTLKVSIRESTNAKKSVSTVVQRETERIQRGITWQRTIGNKLGLTKEHFVRYVEHAEYRKKEVKEGAAASEFTNYCKLIYLDVARTFISLDVIQYKYNYATSLSPIIKPAKPTIFAEELVQILEAYAVFRPAVGYAQGMSHVAGMLLLHMDAVNAFICLCNLTNNHFFVSLFKMDIPEINRHISIYDFLFSDQLPAVYEHFRTLEIYPEQYLLSWISTIFSLTLPFEVACRVWDQFISQGEIFLYRTALGILKFFSSQLLKGSLDETLTLLKQLPQDINQINLLQAIEAVDVPPYIHAFVNKIEVPLTKPY